MTRTDHRPRQRLDPDARRGAILAAATAAFARSTYGEVTVAAVAADAGASEPLVYRYFSGKDHLYAAVLRAGLEDFMTREAEALAALPEGTPARERVRASVGVYLDAVAWYPNAWAAPLRGTGAEPTAAAAVRSDARRDYIERLRTLLAPSTTRRHEYALWGFVGFLDSACLRWVDGGCPADDRDPVVDAVLGALEGALGDWAA
jgi:AcrR family transcriptional regulator